MRELKETREILNEFRAELEVLDRARREFSKPLFHRKTYIAMHYLLQRIFVRLEEQILLAHINKFDKERLELLMNGARKDIDTLIEYANTGEYTLIRKTWYRIECFRAAAGAIDLMRTACNYLEKNL